MKAKRKLMVGSIGLLVIAGLLSGCATVTRQYQAWSEYRAALSLFKAERYGEAQEHVKAALVDLPDRSEFLALYVWTLLKQSRVEEARQLFTRVMELETKTKGVAGFQGFARVDYTLGK
jgi:thioredoxin-like negative regulator of GroEL